MPTQLENAMDTLIKIFHHYSAKEGDKYKLNKGELKQLLTSELTDFLSATPLIGESTSVSIKAMTARFQKKMYQLSATMGKKHESCQKDPQLVDKIMKDLDSNKDNEVDFNEFVVLVAALTVACNDFFEEQMRKKGD